jgi:hypothetical protein
VTLLESELHQPRRFAAHRQFDSFSVQQLTTKKGDPKIALF